MVRSVRVLLLVLLGGALPAQTVHVVGPGGFPQIQAAINAAANGDVVVIQSGVYLPFTLTKDLTITAAPGATVDVVPPALPFTQMFTILQPTGQAKLVGLLFRNPSPVYVSYNQVQVLGGTVAFSDCGFESYGYLQVLSGLLVQNASAVMQRCIVLGGGVNGTVLAGSNAGYDGLEAVHANVAAVDCLFWGSNLNWDFIGRGGHGVLVDDSRVHFANCTAIGGGNDALNPGYAPGDGVHVATTSQVWLADCNLRGGVGNGHVGGTGLANLGGIAVKAARSTFLGGAGTSSGAAVLGPLAQAPLLGVLATTPITLGTTWNVGFVTTPATPVIALWSDHLAISVLPLFVEPWWLSTSAFAMADAGLTAANGRFESAFAIPANPALLHTACFLQAFAGFTLPLEAAPPVGGVVR